METTQPKLPKNSDVIKADKELIKASFRKTFSQGSLYFPPELVPPGKKYVRIATHIYSEPIANAESKAANSYMTKVPQDRHPMYPMEIGGLVMYEIEEQYWEAYQEVLQEEIQKQTQPINAFSGANQPIGTDKFEAYTGTGNMNARFAN